MNLVTMIKATHDQAIQLDIIIEKTQPNKLSSSCIYSPPETFNLHHVKLSFEINPFDMPTLI